MTLAKADRLVRAGNSAAAIPLLRHALQQDPGNAALHHDLAACHLRLGETALAEAGFRLALQLRPDLAVSWLALGAVVQARGDDRQALAAYDRARMLAPALAEAAFRSGALLDSFGSGTQAVLAFEQAARAAPDTPLGHLASARALLSRGCDAPAEQALRRALALDPDQPLALDLLGRILAEAGDLDAAWHHTERAVRLAPQMAGSCYELVRCRRLGPDDAGLIDWMRSLERSAALHPEQRLKLHLALGKAADDLDDPGAAMAHFGQAHRLREAMAPFDLRAFEARIARIIAEALPRPIDTVITHPKPILVVGLPRSGTTLVEQILSSHAEVAAGGELPFWTGCRDDADPAQAASDYRAILRDIAGPGGAAFVTDKMPLNLFHLGRVQAALPDARFVLCRRDPLDTALSIHRTYFNQHVAFPTGGAGLVGAIRACERLAAHWQAVLPPERLVTVEYETLTARPAPTIRALLAGCGLAFDPACLTPERNPGRVRTPSKWQVRQPIHRASVGQAARYAPWLGELAALSPGS